MTKPESYSSVSSSSSLGRSQDHKSMSELLGILAYNQELVEFADSKAGSLILLNSLLIASLGALPNTGNLGAFKLGSVVLCSAAVYMCFQVISSKESAAAPATGAKNRSTTEWEKDDFLFFGCIGKFKTGEDYVNAFQSSNEESRKVAILRRTYIIAKIANRKFSEYKTGQTMTTAALSLWVVVNMLPFLNF